MTFLTEKGILWPTRGSRAVNIVKNGLILGLLGGFFSRENGGKKHRGSRLKKGSLVIYITLNGSKTAQKPGFLYR